MTAFVKPHHRYVADLFPAVGRVVEVEDAGRLRQVAETDLRPGVPFYAHFSPDLMHLLGHRGVTLLDGYRALFRVPMSTPVATPRRPTIEEIGRAESIFDRHRLPAGRTVLLAPEANSSGEFGLDVWGTLADRLRDQGRHPVTNAGPKAYAVPGTERIDIPLELCIPFAERAGWVIAMRSGLTDLLASAATRLSVLYPAGPWFAGSLYATTSLGLMGLSGTAEEFEIEPGSFQATIPHIVAEPTTAPSQTVSV